MSFLNRLQISRVRNITSADLRLSPSVNLFCGKNGSGKTSVLEAVSLLGLGRSFRSHKTRSLISHQQSELTVFAELQDSNTPRTLGVQKERNGSSSIRINRENVPSASFLARQLPLQIINADSFQLIEGAPLQRRQFMDWLVFHVKPEFIDVWQRLQRVTKQRNSLLRRDKITPFDLSPWDDEYIRLSNLLDELRHAVFMDFLQVFKTFDDNEEHRLLQEIQLEYHRGWPEELSLAELVKSDFDRDTRDGYTHHGPHRADIKIKQAGHSAADVLSRGQEKLLICALHIAQARFYQSINQQPCVFLVDDLLAELDNAHASRLADWLLALNSQVFVTGVHEESLLNIWEQKAASCNKSISLFHVEQGQISNKVPLELTRE